MSLENQLIVLKFGTSAIITNGTDHHPLENLRISGKYTVIELPSATADAGANNE